MPEPGELTANRYRLIELIGSGGMGRVWLACDEVLQREVALKEIVVPAWMPHAERDKLRGFAVREGRAAARVNHRHAVAVFDVLYEDGVSWIVMEYVPSRSLDVVLARSGPLPPAEVARLGLGLSSALAAAHRAGVLHRDVKPQNVLVGADGRVVLTDFGLAVVRDAAATFTQATVVIGTPQYVAPERARHGESTAAADVWSLGATLYAAVEGRPPFSRETVTDVLAALVREPPDPMVLAGPLAPVLTGLLRRDPDHRFTLAEAEPMLRSVLAAGARATGSAPVPAAPVAALSSPTRPEPTVAGEPVPAGRADRAGGRRRARRVVVAAAATALFAVAGVAAYAHDRPADVTMMPGAVVAASCGAFPTVPAPSASTDQGDAGPGPTALPAGWRWYTGPGGFRVGVPIGWMLRVDDGVACFEDPNGTRSLAIAPVPPTADPVGYWQDRERRLADADGFPAGYRRIGIEPVIYQRGGADWTYTSDAGDGRREQTLRRLFSTSTGAAYSLSWATRDYEWALNEPNLRVITGSFTAR